MYLLTNGRVITRDEGGKGYYEKGAVAYEGTKIVEVGEEAALRAKYPQAEIIDARGGVIMPAFINAHTHIYSALARGLSIVGNNPTNFYEVLDGTWWAMDRKLTLEGSRASADALYIDCIKQGVTTIFDHHASYAEIPGSLHTIAESAKRFGIRSCLCYEVSDRDGEEKCLQAIQENADFAKWAKEQDDDMIRAMFGGGGLPLVSAESLYELHSCTVLLLLAVAGATPLAKSLCAAVQRSRAGKTALAVLEPVGLTALLAVCTAFLVDGSFNPFLYFRF